MIGLALPAPARGAAARSRQTARYATRGLVIQAAVAFAFLAVAAQLVRLGLRGQVDLEVAINEPLPASFARPDIVDRSGRLIATDIEVSSLYADPALLLDADEAVEKVASVLPGIDTVELRTALSDRNRRFVWIRRGLTPALAQSVHNLGLPGLAFRRELRRAYPMGRLAGQLIGAVTIDNRGLSGIEKHIDEKHGIEAVLAAPAGERPPVRLALDVGAQFAAEDELKAAMVRFAARGAAAVVLEVGTGAVVAAASLPDVDPARPADWGGEDRLDKLTAGTYELGSIFKMLTVAMALDGGRVRLDTLYDVREPLTDGRFTIKDLHPQGRPLSVTEIFLHSSNVGAAMMALEAGTPAQQAMLRRAGLLQTLALESGALAAPQIPERWERIETITISYGHGLAVAPMQFAAAAAALINGGTRVKPTLLLGGETTPGEAVIAPATSARIRDLMLLNVTHPAGTGKRADVPGYEVGGKTGTAEMPGRGGYRESSVISSFLAAFPMRQPRYVVLVMLFEPSRMAETKNQITAGINAAPTAGRIIARIAPLLGVLPEGNRE